MASQKVEFVILDEEDYDIFDGAMPPRLQLEGGLAFIKNRVDAILRQKKYFALVSSVNDTMKYSIIRNMIINNENEIYRSIDAYKLSKMVEAKDANAILALSFNKEELNKIIKERNIHDVTIYRLYASHGREQETIENNVKLICYPAGWSDRMLRKGEILTYKELRKEDELAKIKAIRILINKKNIEINSEIERKTKQIENHIKEQHEAFKIIFSLRDMIKENVSDEKIQSMIKEIENMNATIDAEDKKLTVTHNTAIKTIEYREAKFFLGSFNIIIDFIEQKIEITNNVFSNAIRCPFPHVSSNGSICLGAFQEKTYQALKEMDVKGLLTILNIYLSRYDENSAYLSINYWPKIINNKLTIKRNILKMSEHDLTKLIGDKYEVSYE